MFVEKAVRIPVNLLRFFLFKDKRYLEFVALVVMQFLDCLAWWIETKKDGRVLWQGSEFPIERWLQVDRVETAFQFDFEGSRCLNLLDLYI